MSCDSDGCYGSYVPKQDGTESFWGTITKKGYTCWISNGVITADSLETKIFHSIEGSCQIFNARWSIQSSYGIAMQSLLWNVA